MKELIIKSILSGLPRRMVNSLTGGFTPIFMLHRFLDMHGEIDQIKVTLLRKYLEYIRNKQYLPISMEMLFLKLVNNEPIPNNAVIFTVDDGFSEQFDIMGPIFSQFDIPLTCFVITDFLDEKLWPWDDQVKYICETMSKKSCEILLPDGSIYLCTTENESVKSARRKLISKLKTMEQSEIYSWLENFYEAADVEQPNKAPNQYRNGSWEQAKLFIQQGHSIAAHTKSHRILSQLSDQDAFEEIVGSYNYLKEKIPDCSNIFAYPSGQLGEFTSRDEAIIADSDMIGAVSAIPQTSTLNCNINALPRFSLPETMSEFLQYLSFIEVFKNKIRKNK